MTYGHILLKWLLSLQLVPIPLLCIESSILIKFPVYYSYSVLRPWRTARHGNDWYGFELEWAGQTEFLYRMPSKLRLIFHKETTHFTEQLYVSNPHPVCEFLLFYTKSAERKICMDILTLFIAIWVCVLRRKFLCSWVEVFPRNVTVFAPSTIYGVLFIYFIYLCAGWVKPARANKCLERHIHLLLFYFSDVMCT